MLKEKLSGGKHIAPNIYRFFKILVKTCKTNYRRLSSACKTRMFYMERLSAAEGIHLDKFRNIFQLYCKHLNYFCNVVIVSSHYCIFCKM